MQTIEQAAKDYIDNNGWWKKDEQPLTYEEHQTTFKAGVEFAQQWISVDDALPEDTSNVLVKNDKERKMVGWYIPTLDVWVVSKFENSKDFGTVKFWRPIEYN